jgi:hypothetical protein
VTRVNFGLMLCLVLIAHWPDEVFLELTDQCLLCPSCNLAHVYPHWTVLFVCSFTSVCDMIRDEDEFGLDWHVVVWHMSANQSMSQGLPLFQRKRIRYRCCPSLVHMQADRITQCQGSPCWSLPVGSQFS